MNFFDRLISVKKHIYSLSLVMLVIPLNEAKGLFCREILFYNNSINDNQILKKEETKSFIKNLDGDLFQTPVHKLLISAVGDPIRFIEIIDNFSNRARTVFSISYEVSPIRNELLIKNVHHIFDLADNISIEQLPVSERYTFGMVKPLMNRLSKDKVIQARYGFINGTSMTNQHRSIVFFATADGTYYSQQEGPVRILVFNKYDHSLTRVIEYQILSNLREKIFQDVKLDLSSLIMQFVSHLDLIGD